MRIPMLAIAVLACAFSPALAQPRILAVEDQTNSIPASPPAAEPAPQAPVPAIADKPAAETPPIAPPAAPQEAQAKRPDSPPPRYSFNRVDDGFLRLDNETGRVAYCSARGAGWACEVVPEDRAAFEQEIARLQDRVTGLEKEVAALREPPPPRPPADLSPRPPGKEDDAVIKLPTQEDIDRATVVVQNAWRRLLDMLVSFKNDMMRKG